MLSFSELLKGRLMTSGLLTVFGDRTAKLRDHVLASVRETHDQHAAGQQLMDPKGRRGYGGSIRVKLPNNLCSAIKTEFLDATVWSGGQSGYTLPILNGCVLYAWRTPGGRASNEVPFLTSDVRGKLVDGVAAPQATLFEGYEKDSSLPSHDEDDAAQAVASQIVEGGLRLVLIVVESTPEGLHLVKWGEVNRGQGADLRWISEEVIYSVEDKTTRPISVPERTFADGPLPEAAVTQRIEAANYDG